MSIILDFHIFLSFIPFSRTPHFARYLCSWSTWHFGMVKQLGLQRGTGVNHRLLYMTSPKLHQRHSLDAPTLLVMLLLSLILPILEVTKRSKSAGEFQLRKNWKKKGIGNIFRCRERNGLSKPFVIYRNNRTYQQSYTLKQSLCTQCLCLLSWIT